MNALEESIITFKDKTKFRETLKELLQKNKINAAELARKTNIPSPTIHRLLVGKTEDPKLSTLAAIANYFSVTLDQLLGYTPLDSHEKNLNNHKNISIPIISWRDACNKERLSNNNLNNWVLIDINISKDSFALISKPSMEPRFPAGSILIVDPKIKPLDSNLVIVFYPGIDEATVRKIILDGPKQQLLSVTDNSVSDSSLSNINIIGVVVQTRYSYN